MSMILFLLTYLLYVVNSTVFCNRNLFTSNCGLLTTRGDCERYFRQTGNDAFVNCAWITSTNMCADNTQTCKPSCFVNANTKVSSCSTYDACNLNNFIGGYGNSQICVPKCTSNISCTCQPSYCDWTCPSVITTHNPCEYYDAQICYRYTYYNSTGSFYCKTVNGACKAVAQCVQRCLGSTYTSNCTSISINTCGSYYTTVGNDYYDCTNTYNSGSYVCKNVYTQSYGQRCYPQLPTNQCTGTQTTDQGCAFSINQCNKWFIWANGGNSRQQCKWDYYQNKCRMYHGCYI